MRLPKNYKQVHTLEATRTIVEDEHHKWYGSLGKPTGQRRPRRRVITTCDKCGAQPEFLHAEGNQRLCDQCLP